jgi:YfiH family protein
MKPQPATDFEWTVVDGHRALVCRPLRAHARHLFTTRDWALGSAANGDDPAGWSAAAAALGVSPAELFRVHQVHGASVVIKRRGDRVDSEARPSADIILSDDPEIAIAVQTADCVPLLMADTATGAVAAAHAGWRGLAGGVPGVAIAAMSRVFGTRPADLLVAAGPSISAARYEVGDEVRSRFEAAFGARDAARWFPTQTRQSHWLFDGWGAARDQLVAAGVPPASLHACSLCTAEHRDLFCSYRRDGRQAGRMAAVIRAGGQIRPR